MPGLRLPEPRGSAAYPCRWRLLRDLPKLRFPIRRKRRRSRVHLRAVAGEMACRRNEMVEQTTAAGRLGSSATTRKSSEKELMRIFPHHRGNSRLVARDGRPFFFSFNNCRLRNNHRGKMMERIRVASLQYLHPAGPDLRAVSRPGDCVGRHRGRLQMSPHRLPGIFHRAVAHPRQCAPADPRADCRSRPVRPALRRAFRRPGAATQDLHRRWNDPGAR